MMYRGRWAAHDFESTYAQKRLDWLMTHHNGILRTVQELEQQAFYVPEEDKSEYAASVSDLRRLLEGFYQRIADARKIADKERAERLTQMAKRDPQLGNLSLGSPPWDNVITD